MNGMDNGLGEAPDTNGTSRARARELCRSCDHWEPQMAKDFTTDKGQCRFSAPVVTGGLHGPEITVWPITDAKDYCAQHSALQIVISGEVLPFNYGLSAPLPKPGTLASARLAGDVAEELPQPSPGCPHPKEARVTLPGRFGVIVCSLCNTEMGKGQ